MRPPQSAIALGLGALVIFTLFGSMLSGCELITNFDRSRIVKDAATDSGDASDVQAPILDVSPGPDAAATDGGDVGAEDADADGGN